MRDITLVMIRHSKSCANHLREIAGTHDPAHPLVAASQRLPDPALSAHGAAMARAYGPRIRQILTATHGIDLAAPTTLIGSSGLRRARETANLLFPTVAGHAAHLPHIKEFGNIPENTPAHLRRCRPDFRAFLRHLHELPPTIDTVICIAHGSFLRSEVWPIVAPDRGHHRRFGNLDAIVVRTGLTADGRLLAPRTTDIPWRGRHPTTQDRCSRRVERLADRHRRRTQKKRRME
jgi:broad specificity phosphatase PhoE